MGSSRSTPASMIMAGILQTREGFKDAFIRGNYYEAATMLAMMAALLPEEAYQNGFKLPELPKLEKGQFSILEEKKIEFRQYIDDNVVEIHRQIPKYVYHYFERGRRIKRGY